MAPRVTSIGAVLLLVAAGTASAQFTRGSEPLDKADLSSVPLRTLVFHSGANASLPCAEAAEAGVDRLDWFCRGCGLNGRLHSGGAEDTLKVASFDSVGAVVLAAPERVYVAPTNFSLHMSGVRPTDTGEFFCVVNNRALPANIVRLVVQAIPDSPGRPLIMAFTSRSVNLSWTPPLNTHNSPISHYLIHIRVGEDGVWDSDGNILETSDNATVFGASGLQPFTTYSFRVTAVNAVGRSQHSKESYYMLTLREVPSGKPAITAAHNTSSTSLQLFWRPPPLPSLHGEFLGYRIAYKPRSATSSEAIKEVLIKDPAVDKFIIQNLKTFTQYLVSLQVFNPEGLGPSTTVVVMTDEGVPSMPVNVSMREVTNSSVRVIWYQPAQPNGIIQGYRMYFMHQNFTDVRTVRDPKETMEYMLQGLDPFTRYRIWLKAFTWKNEGEPSPQIEAVTDVAGPSAPVITNLTCKDEQSIFLQWDRPRQLYKTIDYYYIYYRSEEQWQFKEIGVGMNGTLSKGSKILLEGLKTDSLHEVKVRGATRSIYDTTKVYKGQFSEAQKILLRLNCDQVQAFTIVRSGSGLSLDLSAGMIAGVACVVFSLILAVLALALWRKYFTESYYYLDESPSTPAPSVCPDWDATSSTSTDVTTPDGQRVSTAIPASLFIQRVASLHADADIGFAKEFQLVQALTADMDSNTAKLPANQQKNRYPNIVAYDHSRVQLRPLPGQKRGDYVNANFVDGFQKSRAYIATQGPLPTTFDSFWRMVWEQRVKVIVMITNLIERGKETTLKRRDKISKGARDGSERKCDMYWPQDGTAKFGMIEVTMLRETTMATFTVRTFRIRHTRVKTANGKTGAAADHANERYVVQFQFTVWPDHGVPDSPLALLAFVRRTAEANKDTDAPVLVHCSAGVGRTGAYILIDAMLKQLKAKGELNLIAYLKHIRSQRNYLVQTEEQYIFVHDALAEAVACGETNIHRAYLAKYIDSLQSSFTTDENSIPWQLIDRQFKLATAFQPQEIGYAAALRPCNQHKNQSFDYLPMEASRVAVSPRAGIDGSDYINASWLPGFNRPGEFILAQHPMQQTVVDFWQMIWDHGARTVVVLSPVQQQEFGIFWPSPEVDIDLGAIRVKLSDENECSGFHTKDVCLTSLHDGYEFSVRLIFSPSWPHHVFPPATVTDLVQVVQSLHSSRNAASAPLVVVDRFGGAEGATFCALTSLVKQLEFEDHVDIYEYVKMSHRCRPGVWRTQEEYFFLYQLMDSVCCGGGAPRSPSASAASYAAFPCSAVSAIVPIHHHHVHHHQRHVVVRVPEEMNGGTLKRSGTATFQRY